MSATPAPRPARLRRPAKGPSLAEVKHHHDWDAKVAASLTRTTDTAEKWRNGLAGLVTVVLGAMLFRGPESVAKFAGVWGYVVATLFVLAVGLILRGLWQAQHAAAPPVTLRKLKDVLERYGSIAAHEVAVAEASSDRLKDARRLVAIGLATLLAGIFFWWLAPTAGAEDPSVEVILKGKPATVLCGTLTGAGGEVLRIATDRTTYEVNLTDIATLEISKGCRS